MLESRASFASRVVSRFWVSVWAVEREDVLVCGVAWAGLSWYVEVEVEADGWWDAADVFRGVQSGSALFR